MENQTNEDVEVKEAATEEASEEVKEEGKS